MLTTLRNILARKPDTLTDRRAEPRVGCDVLAWLVDSAGAAAIATIVDSSPTGVRVACMEWDFPAKARYLLRADTGAAYRLRCAWYGRQVAGYELKGRVDGAPDGRDPAVDALRTLWTDHQADGDRRWRGLRAIGSDERRRP